MLNVNNIEVMFHGSILVLSGVSLQVADKQMVALLGANGAGKTTTLKAIAGMLHVEDGKVTHGSIEFDGRRIEKLTVEEIARLGIALAMEGRPILEHLNAEENLLVGSYIKREGANIKKDLDMVYGYFPRLKDLRKNTGGYLSGGEQQMLVVGRCLMMHPKLMLLDEPSLGLSPLLMREVFDIVDRIHREEGTAFLIVEQNAMLALAFTEYGYVMENGKVVLDGVSEKLRANEDVREFYLGLSEVGNKKSYREVKHYKRRKRWL
jgi:branched-chain amino acid transport system ATP-binding protein